MAMDMAEVLPLRPGLSTWRGGGVVLSDPGAGASKPKSPFTEADLNEMLKSFRQRRSLGLLPRSSSSSDGGGGSGVRGGSDTEDATSSAAASCAKMRHDGELLRWIRQTWRPRCRVARGELQGGFGEGAEIAGGGAAITSDAQQQQQQQQQRCRRAQSGLSPRGGGGGGGGGTSAEVMGDLADLQLRLEHGYSELNAERRAHNALAEGLRRQGESVKAISAECEQLQEQLAEVQREVQEQTAENGRIFVHLGLQRQSLASNLTQAAVLASVVAHLGPSSASKEGQAQANGEVVSEAAVFQELAACRVQIAALIEENEALVGTLAHKEPTVAVRSSCDAQSSPGVRVLGASGSEQPDISSSPFSEGLAAVSGAASGVA